MREELGRETFCLGDALVDVYGSGPAGGVPVVLLWHGRGPRERTALRALAETVAARGVAVVVPDWSGDRADGGLSDLLASLRFVRTRAHEFGGDADRITLAGWSAGARAAAGVTVNPELVDGWTPHALVGIAASYDAPTPTSPVNPTHDLERSRANPVPTWLVHGTLDTVVDVSASRRFATALRNAGWPVQLTESATDHAGVVMAEYAPSLDRCIPLPATRRARSETARIIRDAAAS